MTQTNAHGKVSLVKELCRTLGSSKGMMLIALYHGQVTVDGYVINPRHDWRWSEKQLTGRVAKLHEREGVLFGQIALFDVVPLRQAVSHHAAEVSR